MPRTRLLVLFASAVLVGCTDSSPSSDAEPSTSTNAPSVPVTQPVDGAEFTAELRRALAPPALPSFGVPLDAFADARDADVAERLDLPPGLYQGIAVVDAVCDGSATPVAADAGPIQRGNDGSGSFAEGPVRITVEGDGSGAYEDGERSITVESDGSGSYEDADLSIEIESDGSGEFHDGRRSLEVNSDGSGSYRDSERTVSVDEDGSGRYSDAATTVQVDADGEVEVEGDDTHLEAILDVLDDRLPLFPPVPAVGSVPAPSPGSSCGTVVRLDANLLFDFDEATVRPDAAVLLDRVAALLAALGWPPVAVEGHTDGIGTPSYNLDLSSRRAVAVADGLGERGAPPDVLEPRGLGETHPLRPETGPDGADDPAARQLNRRVELVLRD